MEQHYFNLSDDEQPSIAVIAVDFTGEQIPTCTIAQHVKSAYDIFNDADLQVTEVEVHEQINNSYFKAWVHGTNDGVPVTVYLNKTFIFNPLV